MACLSLVTALDIEFEAVRDALGPWSREYTDSGLRIAEGTIGALRTVLVRTGMGMALAGQATVQTLQQFPVTCVVNAGIAGGLRPGVQPGDLFVCDLILREEDTGDAGTPVSTDAELRLTATRAAAGINVPLPAGRLVSVRRAVASRKRKDHLVSASGCDLVDMEAHAIATVCRDRQVPLLCLKAICDLADEQTVLDVGNGRDDGQLSPLRLVARAVVHPVATARILAGLKRNVARALSRLQLAVHQVVGAIAGREESIADLFYRETADRVAFVRAIIDRSADQLRGKQVLLKPNIVSLEGYPTTTHPQTLETLITLLQELGCQVLVGDGPAIDGHPARVMRDHPLCAICRRHGIEPINFYATKTRRLDGLHGSYRLPILVEECDYFISLPVLKVHSLEKLVMTGALKNQFGLLGKAARLKFHTAYFASSAPIHRCIAEINSLARPDLFIVDAVDTVLGANELRHGGHAAHLGFMFAGSDPVALDAYGLALLQRLGDPRVDGKHPLEIGYLRLAAWDYHLGSPAYRANAI